ncbi:plasmid mobilization protein [Robbsia andropogonis]|uniref:plasmid mobilization protein n=1 Tax=Robbsia andropogonis TaxID=28092 RepID=UPI0004648503|nr:plasmid mobilization relaxosome protein MobC [Robbsia andropogonis]MCP1121301.1 MobC family plasmid mobilization relaxosome protein [Robbsia andropogonis]MCP1131123.1 MobC family plasmid mobilization relaxosome protein [Robbsia andropogonis]
MSTDDRNTSAEPTRRGRKKLAVSLGKPISTRLNHEQWRTFSEKVKHSGMSSSEFLRDCILTNRTEVVARPPVTAERRRIMYVINKTGNNLNQLAHVANTARLSGKLSETTFAAVADELEMITQLLKAHLYRVD